MDPLRLAPQRWWRLLPVIFVTYSLAYLDRANYGVAAAAGMANDLRISQSLNALIGSLFFLGYFVFQIPGARYAQVRSVRVLVFWSLLLWGLCAALTGLLHEARWLLLIRFALGILEAAVLPGLLIYLARWFTRAERSRANTLLILGNPVTILWMSILSGYLIRALNWRWMFILEGAPAILWAFAWWACIRDRPQQAAWLTAPEQEALQRALREEQAALPARRGTGTALGSPVVILLCVQYFCWNIGVYGFVLWLPSILKESSHLGIVAAGWLSSAPYLLAVIMMLAASWGSDRLLSRKHFVWPCLAMGAVAFYGSYLLGPAHFWFSFTLLVLAGGAMYAPYGPFFAMITDLLPTNVAASATALINSMGALGSFVGAYLVGYLNAATGTTAVSYLFMAGALAVAVLVTPWLR